MDDKMNSLLGRRYSDPGTLRVEVADPARLAPPTILATVARKVRTNFPRFDRDQQGKPKPLSTTDKLAVARAELRRAERAERLAAAAARGAIAKAKPVPVEVQAAAADPSAEQAGERIARQLLGVIDESSPMPTGAAAFAEKVRRGLGLPERANP